ncbi:hypothetical protein H696_06328, partial [Fonticula alba]
SPTPSPRFLLPPTARSLPESPLPSTSLPPAAMSNASTSVGAPPKPTVDLSATVAAALPELEQLAKTNFPLALEKMLELEKQTRAGEDMNSTSRVLVAIIDTCFHAGDWVSLNEYLVLLAKRRGQLKHSIVKMVQHTIALIPQTPDQTTKLALIDTLIAITDGRIYVEVERAQLARLLAAIREASGDIPEAADILQALQVETFGSLSRTDKIDFILEQVRLLAAKGDYIRAGLAIRKISPRTFDRKASAKQKKDRLSSEQAAARVEAAIMTDLKLRYLQLQIVLAMHDEKFLDVCRFFRQIYDTVQHRAAQRAQGLLPAEAISGGDVEMTPAPGPGGAGASEEAALAGGAKALEPSLDPSHVAVSQLKPTRTSAEDDDQQWRQALANMVVFATLAPFDHEQSDMLHRVAAERRLSELPHSPDIIQAFTSSELIVWSQFASKFGEYLSDQHRFGKEAKFKLADVYFGRIVEHNIRIVSRYYQRITLPRLSSMLFLDEN